MTNPFSSRFVLDSFALLAFHRGEFGGPAVRAMLDRANDGEIQLSMAVVNLGEVFYRTARELGVDAAEEALGDFEGYAIALIEIDRELAITGARLKAEHPISYADCIAAALAQQLGAAVVTGDADFRRLEHLVRVEWLPAGG